MNKRTRGIIHVSIRFEIKIQWVFLYQYNNLYIRIDFRNHIFHVKLLLDINNNEDGSEQRLCSTYDYNKQNY